MSTTTIEAAAEGDGPERRPDLQHPHGINADAGDDDAIATAYDEVIEAHERLRQAVAGWVATDTAMTLRERRKWQRWCIRSAVDLGELRDNPFRDGGSA